MKRFFTFRRLTGQALLGQALLGQTLLGLTLLGQTLLGLTLLGLTAAFAGPAFAAEPAKSAASGDALFEEYFERETARLQEACLADVDTLAKWKAKQPELRRQLAEMLGLDPLPKRTPLNPVITGSFEHEGIVVENLHFQSRPGLYVTANLYRPKTQDGPLPAVLYVCGHAKVKKGETSFGNKTNYHYHGAWFARNGYICLMIDTLQLGEIEGLHHGVYVLSNKWKSDPETAAAEARWWWYSRGYTPAGVEAWNSIRAIDYLQSRPEVDDEKIGMTGRSGGGGYSWYTAALDERVKAVVPVAGLTDLENHVVDDCIEGHCDCMFFVNTYRWDFPMVAALMAPRPLLISNTDKDTIFPLDGVVRTLMLARKVYHLYDADKNLALHVTAGPHSDTQELRMGAFVWMNQHLKNSNPEIADPAVRIFEPEQLKVFAELPADELNTRIDEQFVPKAEMPKVPASQTEWEAMRETWLAELQTLVFGGWPVEKSKSKSELNPVAGPKWVRHEMQVQTIDFSSQQPFRLRLWIVSPPIQELPKSAVEVRVLDETNWPAFAKAFGVDATGNQIEEAGTDQPEKKASALLAEVKGSDKVIAFFAPRGVGPTASAASLREQNHMRRRFMLLGQTLATMQVWDVRQAVQALRSLPETSKQTTPISLAGSGDAAVIALYAALFEPELQQVTLADLPNSHRTGPDFLNVLRVLDIPTTVAIVASQTPVRLPSADAENWNYPQAVAKALGWKNLLNINADGEQGAAR